MRVSTGSTQRADAFVPSRSSRLACTAGLMSCVCTAHALVTHSHPRCYPPPASVGRRLQPSRIYHTAGNGCRICRWAIFVPRSHLFYMTGVVSLTLCEILKSICHVVIHTTTPPNSSRLVTLLISSLVCSIFHLTNPLLGGEEVVPFCAITTETVRHKCEKHFKVFKKNSCHVFNVFIF